MSVSDNTRNSGTVSAHSSVRPVERILASRDYSRWSRLPVAVRRALLFVVLVVVWQFYVSVSDVSPLLFVSPLEVAKAFWNGWLSGELANATLATLTLLVLGVLIGIVVAVLLTIFATWSRVMEDVVGLLTSMLTPLPAIAILPLVILWFGIGQTSLVLVIVNAVIWPVAINVSTGFRTVNPTIVMVGRNLGLRGWRMVKDVLIMAALPHIITGLKIGWAFAWRTIIGAELVFGASGKGGGLGVFINEAGLFTRVPEVFAGLITIAFIGIALEAGFNLVERRTLVKWGMKSST